MKRTLYKNLLEWKSNQRRKPLLLQGARQVGKTWLINEFGKKEYTNYIYLNFEQTPNLKTLFTNELSPRKIVDNIGLLLGKKVNSDNTLICFDEIQNCPEALTSLKYFQEHAPDKIEFIDPLSQQITPLFNPRTMAWIDHFMWDEIPTSIIAKTAEALKLNRPQLKNLRRALIAIDEHPPKIDI